VNTTDKLREDLRAVRRRYDELSRGKTAPLRRCRTAGDVALEQAYWHIGGALAHEKRYDLAHVVLLFPLAKQVRSSRRPFTFGQFLRRQLGDGDGAALRFRRLLASNDRDEFDHRLRRVLRLACADNAPVDWGVLGADILWFFAEKDHVRRTWAQHFYAPISVNDPAASTPKA
jgi:CRISPR type I-E-associated protein CasB/Cse2